MKINHIFKGLGLLLVGLHSSASSAQLAGVGIQTGTYSPSFTNSAGATETVDGKGILMGSFVYEVKPSEQMTFSVPVSISYARFGTEMAINSNQTMTNKAQSLGLGVGYKQFFADPNAWVKPYVHVGAQYEAMIKSTYYYDEFQNGNLDWSRQLFGQLKGGVRIDGGLGVQVDLFAAMDLGLLNRLSTAAIYRERCFSVGANVLFGY
jgi:hypothetical protein